MEGELGDTNKCIEPILRKQGSIYYVSLHKNDEASYVPVTNRRIGNLIYASSRAENEFWQSEDEDDISERINHIFDIFQDMNCHAFVAYALGVDIDEITKYSDDSYESLIEKLIPYDKEYLLSPEDLKKGVYTKDNFPFAVTLYMSDSSGKKEVIHSFIALGLDTHGDIVCFHKPGHGLTQGSNLSLEPMSFILDSYIYTMQQKQNLSFNNPQCAVRKINSIE